MLFVSVEFVFFAASFLLYFLVVSSINRDVFVFCRAGW